MSTNTAFYDTATLTDGKNLGYDYDVAIRASLKSDPKKVFAVTVVHVKK